MSIDHFRFAVGLAAVFLGCSSSGEDCLTPRLVDGACLGERDASDAPDSGPRSDVDGIGPGDLLLVEPRKIEVVQGWVRCVRIIVLHAVGTQVALRPSDVEVQLEGPGASQAELSQPNDCAGDGAFGIIGRSAGEAGLTVRFGAVSFPARLHVIPAVVRAESRRPGGLVAPLGATSVVPYPFSLQAYDPQGRRIEAGEPVRRWRRLILDDADLAILESLDDENYAFTGRATGTGKLTATYAGPVGEFVADHVDFTVIEPGELEEVLVRLYQPGTSVDVGALEIGVCFDAVLFGGYRSGDTSYQARLERDVVWTASGLQDQGEARYCINQAGTGALSRGAVSPTRGST